MENILLQMIRRQIAGLTRYGKTTRTRLETVEDAVDIIESEGGAAFAQTVIYTTASIADNAEESGVVVIAKTFHLLKMEVSRASRVRVYSTAAYRTADAARVIGEIPSGEHGVIADGNLLADNLILDMMPIPVGTNAEAARTSSIPIKIQNKSGAVGTVAVTFTFLIIEA